jgi:hypothetical protein
MFKMPKMLDASGRFGGLKKIKINANPLLSTQTALRRQDEIKR